MTARVGSMERLAEVRSEQVRRLRQWTPAQRSAWRTIDRLDAADAADQAVAEGYPASLRRLSADELEAEALEVGALPTSPTAWELRHEAEIEQAGRRWQATVRIAEVIGWEAVIDWMRTVGSGTFA